MRIIKLVEPEGLAPRDFQACQSMAMRVLEKLWCGSSEVLGLH